jgi:hypothetical protein
MKMINRIMTIAILVGSFGEMTKALADDVWVGNIGYKIERGAYDDCRNYRPLGSESINFSSWVRQRASVSSVCFEVYKKDVTEYYRSWDDIDKYLGLHVYPLSGGAPSGDGRKGLKLVGRNGNNAVYALDLRAYDPFQCCGSPVGDAFSYQFGIYVNGQDLNFAVNNQKFSVIYSRN